METIIHFVLIKTKKNFSKINFEHRNSVFVSNESLNEFECHWCAQRTGSFLKPCLLFYKISREEKWPDSRVSFTKCLVVKDRLMERSSTECLALSAFLLPSTGAPFFARNNNRAVKETRQRCHQDGLSSALLRVMAPPPPTPSDDWHHRVRRCRRTDNGRAGRRHWHRFAYYASTLCNLCTGHDNIRPRCLTTDPAIFEGIPFRNF